jgi:hypothetical protein
MAAGAAPSGFDDTSGLYCQTPEKPPESGGFSTPKHQ